MASSAAPSTSSTDHEVLMILSSTLSEFFDSNTPETILCTSKMLTKLLQNAIQPGNNNNTNNMDKFRKIRLSNPKIQAHIVRVQGAMNVLALAGFIPASGEEEWLVYLPNNDDNSTTKNALELYLEEEEKGSPQNLQQEDLVRAICQGLDVKVDELQAAAETTRVTTAAAATTNHSKNEGENNSPFLSEEERLKRLAKIKAMKKAKKQAQKQVLTHWEEDAQDRKEMEARREALLQAKVKAEATEGLPVGVTIHSTAKKVPLPLAKPMAPAASEIEEQRQLALAEAARARMQRAAAAGQATNPVPAAASRKPSAAAAAALSRLDGTDRVMDEADDKENEEIPDSDKKPAAQKRPAESDAAMEDTLSPEALQQWQAFLDHVPRCTSAEGIRESSCFRGEAENTVVPTKCLKKLFKELDGLNDLLPSNHNSSIWVRFDEESPQYIRALVAAVLPGPTPYSGGLFLFDIYVPGEYPQTAPKFRLISRGSSENFSFGPNLYPNGYVCLSILTGGPGWIPGHSTLLQVLVSIQGLMLGIEHPYYLMRGGWDGTVKEGDFQATGKTLTGKTVTEQVGIDATAVLYEDKLRIGTIRYTMMEPMKASSCRRKLDNDKDMWQPFYPIIQAHFSTNRDAILTEVQKWRQDSLMGRDRSVANGNAGLSIDELNHLFPKLQTQLSKMVTPFLRVSEDATTTNTASHAASVAATVPAASLKSSGEDDEDMAVDTLSPAENAGNENEEENAMDIEEGAASGTSRGNIDVIEKKRKRMQEAAGRGDYVRAGQLQEEVKRLEQLQRSIDEAAKQNDFIRAGRLQAQLKALTDQDPGGAPTGVTRRRPPQNQNDMEEDEEMSDDDEDDEEEEGAGNLAEAMANANFPGMGNAARGGVGAAGRAGVPQGLGRNVFAPPRFNAHVRNPNHQWGSGATLSASPAAAPNVSETSAAAPTAAKKIIPPTELCRLRVRLPTDKSVVEDFEKSEPLSAVYRRISSLMTDGDNEQAAAAVAPIVNGAGAFSQPLSSAGFTLLLTRPKREFSLEMHGAKTLDELNLAPSATLTLMKCSDRGVLHRGELESRLRQARGDALDVDGLTYEGLVELTERVGNAVPAEGSAFVNLTAEDLENNSETFSPSNYLAELDSSMEEHGEDERRCPICLGEYDQSDTSASLRKLKTCSHIFHSACLETWLRTKSSCPLCKKAVNPES